jgi:hypothetical protein
VEEGRTQTAAGSPEDQSPPDFRAADRTHHLEERRPEDHNRREEHRPEDHNRPEEHRPEDHNRPEEHRREVHNRPEEHRREDRSRHPLRAAVVRNQGFPVGTLPEERREARTDFEAAERPGCSPREWDAAATRSQPRSHWARTLALGPAGDGLVAQDDGPRLRAALVAADRVGRDRARQDATAGQVEAADSHRVQVPRDQEDFHRAVFRQRHRSRSSSGTPPHSLLCVAGICLGRPACCRGRQAIFIRGQRP